MAPPSQNKVTCYLFRDRDTKLWTADTADLPDCRTTCMQPEDTLKRIQAVVLHALADRVNRGEIELSDKVEVFIDVQLVKHDDADRLLGKSTVTYDEYGYGGP